MDVRIAVTGIGMFTPAGCTPGEVLENLCLGRSGIRPVQAFDTEIFVMKNAGEVRGFVPHEHFSTQELVELDRATQMGILAAENAWASANLSDVDSTRVGLLTGTSGAGQYQNARYTRARRLVEGPVAASIHLRNLPHFHAATIAQRLQIRGPVLAFTCASASSAIAIGQAANLIRAGKVDVAVAGGSEALTVSSVLAMDTMQLCVPGQCSPFSGSPGMSLGEGAAFLVLERYDYAIDRGADILAELFGCGVTSDAYDSLGSDPSGHGIARAMAAAMKRSGSDAGQIQWIKASGCSNRDQDLAETSAIKDVFAGCEDFPPVTSLESTLGHANGASGALGLAAAIVCRRAEVIPATLNFSAPRQGCDLDYVPNIPRQGSVSRFIANSVAFGGTNVTLVAGAPAAVRETAKKEPAEVAITGLGVVSPVGCGVDALVSALRQKLSGIGALNGFATPELKITRAGLVRVPPGRVRGIAVDRTHRLLSFAAAAVAEALADARLVKRVAPERIGLLVAMSRGPAAGQERLYESLCSYPRTPAIGRTTLKAGRFYVTSTLAHWFQVRGFSATISEGITAGLHAILQAREILRQFDDHDAIIVVAADELSALPLRIAHDSGFLASNEDELGERLRPYDPESRGTILGEGAAAVVIERLNGTKGTAAELYASIAGCGSSNDAEGYLQLEPEGRHFGSAIDQAMLEAGLSTSDISLIYGHGRGIPAYDRREIRALRTRFENTPIACVIGNLGLAESGCGLFSVAAAAQGIRNQEIYPVATEGQLDPSLPFITGPSRRLAQTSVLVAGGTESGANAALVLSRV